MQKQNEKAKLPGYNDGRLQIQRADSRGTTLQVWKALDISSLDIDYDDTMTYFRLAEKGFLNNYCKEHMVASFIQSPITILSVEFIDGILSKDNCMSFGLADTVKNGHKSTEYFEYFGQTTNSIGFRQNTYKNFNFGQTKDQ